jgi:hypothetical protein
MAVEISLSCFRIYIIFSYLAPVKHATRYYTPRVKTHSKEGPYIRRQKRCDCQRFYKRYEHLRP